MKAADYAALAAQLDAVLHLGISAADHLIPTEVSPKTVAARLADIWWGTPALLPAPVGKSKRDKAAAPKQHPLWKCRLEFQMLGPLVATARPRVFKGGGIGLPLPSVLFRRAIQCAAMKKGAEQIPSDDWLVGLQVAAWQPNRAAKPDVDNLAKGVMDALEGLGLFRDQRVTNLSVSKCTGQSALLVRVSW